LRSYANYQPRSIRARDRRSDASFVTIGVSVTKTSIDSTGTAVKVFLIGFQDMIKLAAPQRKIIGI